MSTAKTQTLAFVLMDSEDGPISTQFTQPLSITKWQDAQIPFTTALASTGLPANLTGGAIILTVRRNFFDHDPPRISREATATNFVVGTGYFPIGSNDTGTMAVSGYQYDAVYIDAAGKRWPLIPQSLFEVTEAITIPGTPVTVPSSQQPLAQGPPGLPTVITTWSNAVTYTQGQGVTYSIGGVNSTYLAVGNPPAGTLPTNATYWLLIVSGGDSQLATNTLPGIQPHLAAIAGAVPVDSGANSQTQRRLLYTDIDGTPPVETLQNAYLSGANQADSTIPLDSTRLGVVIKDAATPISGELLSIQTNAGIHLLDVDPTSVKITTTSPSGLVITPATATIPVPIQFGNNASAQTATAAKTMRITGTLPPTPNLKGNGIELLAPNGSAADGTQPSGGGGGTAIVFGGNGGLGSATNNTPGGTGGPVLLESGLGGGADSTGTGHGGNAGTVSVVGASGGGGTATALSGLGGPVRILSGPPGSPGGGLGNAGSDITITASAALGSGNNNGGSVNVTLGAATGSGTPGVFNINGVATLSNDGANAIVQFAKQNFGFLIIKGTDSVQPFGGDAFSWAAPRGAPASGGLAGTVGGDFVGAAGDGGDGTSLLAPGSGGNLVWQSGGDGNPNAGPGGATGGRISFGTSNYHAGNNPGKIDFTVNGIAPAAPAVLTLNTSTATFVGFDVSMDQNLNVTGDATIHTSTFYANQAAFGGGAESGTDFFVSHDTAALNAAPSVMHYDGQDGYDASGAVSGDGGLTWLHGGNPGTPDGHGTGTALGVRLTGTDGDLGVSGPIHIGPSFTTQVSIEAPFRVQATTSLEAAATAFDFDPAANDTYHLGTSSLRWKTSFIETLTTGTGSLIFDNNIRPSSDTTININKADGVTSVMAINTTTGAVSVPGGVTGAGGSSFQVISAKGNANGYAGLDGSAKVPLSQLPATVVSNTYVVVSQAAMLALSANIGDLAVRSDISTTFVLQSTPASTLGNWIQLLNPDADITSISTGSGLSGGPITSGSGTIDLRLNASGGLVKNLGAGTNELGIGAASVSNAMLANGAVTNLSGVNTGDITLSAVDSTPNASGASLSGQILTLQPADGTNPGVLTAAAQTIGGAKSFSGGITSDTIDAATSAGAWTLGGTNAGAITLGNATNGTGVTITTKTTSLTPLQFTNNTSSQSRTVAATQTVTISAPPSTTSLRGNGLTLSAANGSGSAGAALGGLGGTATLGGGTGGDGNATNNRAGGRGGQVIVIGGPGGAAAATGTGGGGAGETATLQAGIGGAGTATAASGSGGTTNVFGGSSGAANGGVGNQSGGIQLSTSNATGTGNNASGSIAMFIGSPTGSGASGQVTMADTTGTFATMNSTAIALGLAATTTTQAGNLAVPSGSNKRAGTATLSTGTVTVSNTTVTANSLIFLTDQGGGVLANIGSLSVGTVTAGTSFVINSSNTLDSSIVGWWIIEKV